MMVGKRCEELSHFLSQQILSWPSLFATLIKNSTKNIKKQHVFFFNISLQRCVLGINSSTQFLGAYILPIIRIPYKKVGFSHPQYKNFRLELRLPATRNEALVVFAV